MNFAEFRELFPVTRELIHLNHAGVAPLSQPAADAMRAYIDGCLHHSTRNYDDWLARLEAGRAAFARLINAQPEEIAYVKNTSHGLIIAAQSILFRPGDNVVVFEGEFPANIYPWLALESSGVQVRWVRPEGGRITPEMVEAALDKRTRAVALSHVQFLTGFRADLEPIGRICRERGIYFVVDIIQSVGAVPVDVRAGYVDMAAADGHKWLLGPEGIGFLYCRREILDELRGGYRGWHSVAHQWDFEHYDPTPHPTAQRFEEGSYNMAGGFGLAAAVELLESVGIPAIWDRIRVLTDEIIRLTREAGYEILSPVDREEERSGIITFRVPGEDNELLVKKLRERGILCAHRAGGIRLSPHAYNNEEDIAEVFRRSSEVKEREGGIIE